MIQMKVYDLSGLIESGMCGYSDPFPPVKIAITNLRSKWHPLSGGVN
jgi:hypothetical protein